ncbi:MAG: transcriptional regulator, partial [Deltaproteobacteria bacterium]
PTPAGRAAVEDDAPLPSLFADALDDLDDEERRVLYRAALKMIRRLQRQGRIPVSAMCVTCTYFRPNVHPGPSPHHCALVDEPMADTDLRLDCPDHVPAPADVEAENFARFRRARAAEP